jgi:hypothetical protein
MGIDGIDILKPQPEDLKCSAGNPAHQTCTHFQLIEGRMVQVEKDELYDYCTDDPE